ncbi:LysR family transcriptional regulator [Sulfitobacter aestuarii]|uniref:LysR family transcriptional regulator n=1 Tax=Sulfitobacter aestuarii TaxID=2161676 RepID=A0ABW5TZM6_9RHOB
MRRNRAVAPGAALCNFTARCAVKPTIKQIEAFVQVADQGSFRRAAVLLNTTQPNISARIASLEELLDARLMERDAGSVRLTPGGLALLPHARAVLRSLEGFSGALGNLRLMQGALRLGVTELVVHTWLPDFLRALKAEVPNVVVELTVDLSANLSKALADRVIDLCFQSGPFPRASSGHVDLGRYPLIWVVGPELAMNAQAPLTLPDLAAHPILTHARGTLPYDQLAAHVAAAQIRGARLVPSSNLAACLQMALDGYGVACLPIVMVAPALGDGRLVRLDFDWVPEPLHFAARFDAERAPDFLGRAVTLAQRYNPEN